MPLQDFNEQIRERRLAHFKSVIEPTLLDTVFGLPRLERLLHEESRLTPYLDVFDGTDLRQLVEQRRKPGQTNFDVVADDLRRGATIRIRNVERFDPPLAELIEGVEHHFVGQCAGNVYLTPPEKTGFPPHFDLTDVFVVQCNGKKHWRIYDHYTNMSELPLPDVRWEPERFKPTSAPRDFELGRGDVLYLPRGTMHEAFCTDRESMHVTISLASLTLADVLRKAVTSAAASDIELRRRVPWSSAADAGEIERTAQYVKDRLVRLSGDSDLVSLLRQERAK
jgi:ribosomal protein L16 Arg81 hydroxylase